MKKDFVQDFLFKLEDEQVSCNTTANAVDTFHNSVASSNADNPNDDGAIVDETDEQFSLPSLSPAGVMGWLTGQQHKALNGESMAISVMFNHDCTDQYPGHVICYTTVAACGKLLTPPVNHMKKAAEFNEIFIVAYCGGQFSDQY